MAQAISIHSFCDVRVRAREFILLVIGITIGILISIPSHHYTKLLPKASPEHSPTPPPPVPSNPPNVYNTQILKTCPSTANLSRGITRIHCLHAPRSDNNCTNSYTSWTSDLEDPRDRIQAKYHRLIRLLFKYPLSIDILDIGTNIGVVTFGSLAINRGHHVMAVEPVQIRVADVCRTAQLNGWFNSPHFSLVRAALSDRVGMNTIDVPVKTYDNASIASNKTYVSKENVVFLDGDGLLEETGFTPRMIRVRANGYELFALKGLKKYMRDRKRGHLVVIVELEHENMQRAGADPKEFFELMVEELGYVAYCRPRFDVGLTGYTSVRRGIKLSKNNFPPKEKKCKESYYVKE